MRLCDNSCPAFFTNDGVCDDGGEGSRWNNCGQLGTDCADCGERWLGSARERRIGRVGRHAVRLAVIGGELALHFFATTRLGAYYYVLSSLGMLTAATAVEAWGKRPRKAAGEATAAATVAAPAAPLLQ